MVFSVFLPPSASTVKVPALYYLSGLTCTDKNFVEKGLPYEKAAAYGIAIIAPDTSPRGAGIEGEDTNWDFGTGAGFYVDATEDKWKKNYNMYSYITQELPALVENHFSISAKKAIFGHSMGGHGALVCYLKNPGAYTSCSAYAPICNPIQCPWGQKAFTGYLGPNRELWEEYDATCLVGNYTGTKYTILIDQGTSDGFLEKKQLLPENFVQACEAADFPVNLRMQQGYDHSYFFIRTFIDDHIQHHAEALGCTKRRMRNEKDETEEIIIDENMLDIPTRQRGRSSFDENKIEEPDWLHGDWIVTEGKCDLMVASGSGLGVKWMLKTIKLSVGPQNDREDCPIAEVGYAIEAIIEEGSDTIKNTKGIATGIWGIQKEPEQTFLFMNLSALSLPLNVATLLTDLDHKEGTGKLTLLAQNEKSGSYESTENVVTLKKA